MAAFGALAGVGVLAAVASVRGVRLFPGFAAGLERALMRSERLAFWSLLAFVAASATWAWTRWPVGGLWVLVGVLAIPLVGAETSHADREIAKIEAIATWTEQVRDTMNASAGLQQALVATAANGPAAIAPALAAFARRAPRGDLGGALEQLGADIDHPSADLVIAGLLSATELDAGRLVPLLSRLAQSIRDDADMRVRVEVGRARIRTSMRIVSICVGLTILLLLLAGRDLLDGYGTAMGQLWLVVVGAVVVIAVWSTRRLARIPQPERFVARRAVP